MTSDFLKKGLVGLRPPPPSPSNVDYGRMGGKSGDNHEKVLLLWGCKARLGAGVQMKQTLKVFSTYECSRENSWEIGWEKS